MSVYVGDRLDHIQESVNSLINQTLRAAVVMLYIDGPVKPSVNNYLNVLEKEYECIKIFRSDHNKGLARALNCLIDQVLNLKGIEFIARMDADDISLPIRFEKQIQFLTLHQHVQLVGSSCIEFGEDLPEFIKHQPINNTEIRKAIDYACPLIHPTIIFRREIFERGVRYPEDKKFCEDIALWMILKNSSVIFSNIDIPLLKFRNNKATMIRRLGYKKGIAEFTLRMSNIDLSVVGAYKIIPLLFSRLILHILPLPIFLAVRYSYLTFQNKKILKNKNFNN